MLFVPFACRRLPPARENAKSGRTERRGKKSSPKPRTTTTNSISCLADTVDQVDRNYVKEVDRRELIEAAIRGVMTKLDPYSAYIGPEELAQFRSSVDNEFGGIGIHVSVDDGDLKVLSPIYGTPAYRAGIQAGDRIVEIEGKSTDGIQPDDAIRWMKGAEGTKVSITVVHAGQTKREKFTLTRERRPRGDRAGRPPQGQRPLGIHVRRKGPDRLHSHHAPSARKRPRNCAAALEDLKQRNVRGLVLDLRFNPGGLLRSAIEVSNLFISSGRIVSTKGRNTPERVWDAHGRRRFEGFPW